MDWSAIERSPAFRELVESRRRFTFTAGAVGIGIGALYVVLAALAPDLMGTEVVGEMSLGFLGGVGLIVMTWVITHMYMRRSDRVWGPLEEQVRREAGAQRDERFSKAGVAAPAREEQVR